jgi:delta11-fatty-acid desaturase
MPVRYTENTKWNIRYDGQEKRFFILTSFGLLATTILSPLVLSITNVYNTCVYEIPTEVKYKIFHFFETILYIYVFFILPFQIWTPFYAIKHAVIPYYILSSIFFINASINHIHKDSIKGYNKNWYIHQVTTANNFGSHWPHYYLSIGLNYQIEHHLFPTVNHCHLRDIQPIVKKLCVKHGIPYHHTGGYKEALMGVYEHFHEMGKKPVTKEVQEVQEVQN